ncbi:hypothetical protein GGR54DRAFT_604948 [Hypoxylon sp. NC1633]|nr:hypothetical protein GGR54DRAFT_604948 [Hypoxylon sp. NC1633]
MADPQPSETPPGSTMRARGSQSRGRRAGDRRGRGSQNHNRGGGRVAENQVLPTDTQGSQGSTLSPARAGAAPNANSRGGRGQRGHRGSPRRSRENGSSSTLGRPRTFGSHLTTNAEDEESDPASAAALNANASEFIPGQPPQVEQSDGSNRRQQAKRSNHRRKAERSTAEDLPTRIHEDIINGQYECVICTNEVLPNSKVWSCSICWTAIHMSCVNIWFSSQTRNAEVLPANWRCPGCNSPMSDEPTTYHCWCSKEINPRPIPGLPPHSCGQSCSKPRVTCPHPCPLQCHAGPCPPCQLMGPSLSCYCGKHISSKRCSQTDYVNGWSCHEVCGDLLPCGEHECQQECHSGLCGSCETPVLTLCYCGREFKHIPCEQRKETKESYNYGQIGLEHDVPKTDGMPDNWYLGSFGCNSICDRPFDCGKHQCEKECHPQDENPAHCPLSPDLVTHCHCGKTPLVDILPQHRESCSDPIPSCGDKCKKTLPCGHLCRDVCHPGPCSTCMQRMDVSCRCGRTKSTSTCHQGTLEIPECRRICHAQLNCGRHEHGEHCCPGEKKATERVAATRRKNRNAGLANDEIEAEHICTRTCGRELKCGNHQCRQMCHKGPCPSCPEAIFEEISCNCERTKLQPPQPCGTQPPKCLFDCTRPRPCGHQAPHKCHADGEPCSKCPFLVEKRCICGKKKLKNQPCWFEEPRCGLPCGQKLKCGTHTCKKTCHRSGECEDAGIVGSRCKQPCGKTRSCGHSDGEQCHAPYPCKEDKPCQAKTFITCECQRMKKEVRCMASKTNPSPQRDALKCDEECLRLQRNARLADALNIDPETHTDDHVPYSDTTLEFYKNNLQLAEKLEREYRIFAADPTQKQFRFKPMKASYRAFLHSLAEDFGFDSESADPEPNRHVILFKTPRFVSAPMKTIAQSLKIRALTQQTPSAPSLAARGEDTTEKPYNGLLLSAPRFGLTTEELDSTLQKQYAAYPSVKFHTSFLPSEDIVIKGSGAGTPQILESSLTSLKPALLDTVRRLGLAQNVFLCHTDDSLNVLRSEKDAHASGEGGWSSVVGRSAARPQPKYVAAAPMMLLRNNFMALSKEPKKEPEKEPKKKIEQEPVEEDWEEAANKLDEE